MTDQEKLAAIRSRCREFRANQVRFQAAPLAGLADASRDLMAALVSMVGEIEDER